MLRFLRNIAPLLFLALSLAACTGGDEDPNMVATAARAELQGAILGNLDRMNYFTDKEGKVQGEKMAVTGSNFPLKLDTLNKTVYNVDSLPVHTFMDQIYFSTFIYVGTPYIQMPDSTWVLYEYTKPQDFSSPRKVGIKSTDGTKTVEYTIDIRVHKENGDSMQWRQFSDAGLPTNLSNLRMLAKQDSLYLWGRSGGATLCYKALDTLANKWTKVPITKNTPDVTSIVKQGDRFCGLTEHHIVSSENGSDWQVLAERPEGMIGLVAASSRSLYGISDHGFMRALLADLEWVDETTAPLQNMPTHDFCSAYQSTVSNALVEEITVIGHDAAGGIHVWRRNDMREAKHEATAKAFAWTYIEKESSKYPVPERKEISMGYYDGGVLMSGLSHDGKLVLSISQDSGITWPTTATIATPAIDLGTPAEGQGQQVAMTIDAAHHIWLYAGGQLWRGHLNRMMWKAK